MHGSIKALKGSSEEERLLGGDEVELTIGSGAWND